MRRLTLALGGLLAAAATTLVTAPAATAQETGSVYVVHGIPNTPGRRVRRRRPCPRRLRAGHERWPGRPARGRTPGCHLPGRRRRRIGLAAALGQSRGAGGRAMSPSWRTWTRAGKPTVTPFVNDVSSVPAGQARVVVRHTAAAPAVDVLAGGTPVVNGLTNPNEEALEVPAGTISAAVAAAGTTDPVIGPADLDLQEGTATFVHAIGSLQDNTLGLVVVTVDGLHSSPSGVPSGAPSGAPFEPGLPAGLVLAAGAGAALAGASAYRLARR